VEVASKRVEDTQTVGLGQYEVATVGGADLDAFGEERHVLAEEASRGGVHEDTNGTVIVSAKHDPFARPKTHVPSISGVVGGMAPVSTDGAEVHVIVDIVGGQNVVGDVSDELGWERVPARSLTTAVHGPEGRSCVCPFSLL
jgi:hypothetical protein